MRNEPSAIKKATDLKEDGITIFVGAPTIFELFVGVSLSKKAADERSKITKTISALPLIPLDYPSAVAGGEVYGEKFKAGMNIDPEDAKLAGISKVHGEPILTRNVKHLSGIHDVKIETY